MKGFTRVISSISRGGGAVSCVFLVMMVLLILAEVIGRGGFGWSTRISDEYSAYFLVALVFTGVAYTLKVDGHIKIRIITSRLSPRNQDLLEIFVCILCVIFLGYLAWQSWGTASGSYQADTRSLSHIRTPLFIPQVIVAIGLAMISLQFIARAFEKGVSLWNRVRQVE